MGCDTISAPYRRRKKKVAAGKRRLWRLWKLKTTAIWKPLLKAQHPWESWEAFSKDINTHDKLQRMGKYSFWICMKQSNNLIWTSAASSCTKSSSANHRYPPDLSYKHCLQTVLHHSTLHSALFNNGYVMKYQDRCWQDRGGWLVPAETDNPVAPDDLCNACAKLHVAEHVDARRQD